MDATVEYSTLCLQALVTRLAEGTGGRCLLWAGTTLVADAPMAVPAGSIDAGVLTLAASAETAALVSMVPTVAELVDHEGVALVRGACRMAGAPDTGQPVVVGSDGATEVYAGALVQITAGTLTLLPAP